MTVWGHLKASAGAWALAPFRMAAAEKVGNQAVMVSLGRPGAGEELLRSYGFSDVERLDVPFAWEFADPELYARALASTGPAYEAIQNVGEAEFHRAAVEQARERLRDGLPLRADINVVGYLARKPKGAERSLRAQAFTPSGLSFRQRGILVTAAASALGDSYCLLAWGGKLGTASDAATAAGVLNGPCRRRCARP